MCAKYGCMDVLYSTYVYMYVCRDGWMEINILVHMFLHHLCIYRYLCMYMVNDHMKQSFPPSFSDTITHHFWIGVH